MIENLKQTFRWFGPNDAVTLNAIGQTGARGIVTALHDIKCGEAWPMEAINDRKRLIAEAGLSWSVVESVNIHEDIKIAGPLRDEKIDNYIMTLRNLAAAGIRIVCYNFMPVLDWTRTHLDYRLPNDASALRYHAPGLAAFDLFILGREEAFTEFNESEQLAAKSYLDSLSTTEKDTLVSTILAGLPGTDEVFTIDQFREHLAKYKNIDARALRANLKYFLEAIIPIAEEFGIKMCIHPDDPPFPILGLPRVVCNESDLQEVLDMYPSPSNGITFCTGSLGANPANDIPSMLERFGPHVHFLHLRNVQREDDGSFYEAEHLSGSTDMYLVMKAIIIEQYRREKEGRTDLAIPMRPDHGHLLWTDGNFDTYPGYSLIGRLKGLAELRGLELGIKRTL